MNARELWRECRDLLAPPPELTVSKWADQHRELTAESAAKQGRWRTKSFQVGPLDACSDARVSRVVIKSATQMLKTETILNAIGYYIDCDPGPILVLQPGQKDAEDFSKERIDPMIRACSRLRNKVAAEKSRTSANTVGRKYFPGGLLAIVHASSPRNVARRAIRFLFCDEVDKYPASAGVEGNPINLARKRLATFRHRAKEIDTCSPTLPGSEIDRAYEQSDKREFFVPCPACGHMQSMMSRFASNVRWDSSLPTREAQAASARYICVECGAAWDDAARWRAVEAGEWRASEPFAGVAGFWISELYSPWKQLREIVGDYLKAKDDPESLKTFINTSLAENWTEPGEQLEWERVLGRREDYPVGVVPVGGLFLVAAVDVQREDGGRLEVRVNAYGQNRERWAIDYRILPGNPADPLTWAPLEAMLQERWPTAAGGDLGLERVFVDSGDGTVTSFVYDWVSKQPRNLVFAIKGDRRSDQPVTAAKPVEITVSGKKFKYGICFKALNPDYFKAQFYADLAKRPPTDEERAKGFAFPQGYFHIPRDSAFGDEHCKQLCSERLVSKRNKKGRTVTEWELTRKRNEALDTQVYCDAAAWDFGAHRFQPAHWDMLRKRIAARPAIETAAPANKLEPSEKREPWIPRRRGGWLQR